MGYHSGLNGEYNIPVEVNSKHIAHFRRCCKEEVPEKAIKVETYLKDLSDNWLSNSGSIALFDSSIKVFISYGL